MKESKDVILLYLKNQKDRAFMKWAEEMKSETTDFGKTAWHNLHVNSIDFLIKEREVALSKLKDINKKK